MEEAKVSFDNISRNPSPEWLPMVIISSVLVIGMIVLDVITVIKHKKYSIRMPIQFISSVGILQVFPFFAIMQFVGLIVPNAHDVTLFLTESYEALTFVFFLRLLFTFMGGKKATKTALKGDLVHLNYPPICCLVCIPPVKFTRKFFIFCEILVGFYVLFCTAVGFLELLITLDGSMSYPGTMITGKFAAVYHTLLIVFLFFAIYGLSGIYHSAEDRLRHRGIVKKFLVYKIFTLTVKLEDLILGKLVHHDVIDNEHFEYNEWFTAALRTRNIYAFAVIIQAVIAFPIAIRIYSTENYEYKAVSDNGVEKIVGEGEGAIPMTPVEDTV